MAGQRSLDLQTTYTCGNVLIWGEMLDDTRRGQGG